MDFCVLTAIQMTSGGVQSLERAIGLLRLVATAYKEGVRLSDLVANSGLPHPTVHRLLKELIAGGLLTQDREKCYRLGHFSYELGLAASSRYGLKELCRPYIKAVAEETGDTAFLMIRSGEDSFCLDRQEGIFPVKVLPVEVGHRRPLGVGGGGLAILSFLPEEERELILQKIAPSLGLYSGLTPEILRERIQDARTHGYAVISNYAVADVTSIGQPIFDRYGNVVAAVSVSGITPRMQNDRQTMIVACLKRECQTLQQSLWSSPGVPQ